MSNSEPFGPMGILGDAIIGETLIARPNSIRDEDGINLDTAQFQWLRDGLVIPGADQQTYVVSEDDAGARISARYIYRDYGGTLETVTSDPRPAVPYIEGTEPDAPVTPPVDHVNSAPIGDLVIMGMPIEGTNLMARADTVFDRDGFDASSASFQWLRDGEPIAGATSRTYTIQSADRGAELSVEMRYIDGAGTEEVVVSQAENPVPYPPGQEPVSDVTLEGTFGNDRITVSDGVIEIDGHEGVDTAVFEGDPSNYTINFGAEGVSVLDRSAKNPEAVSLKNVEFIDFGATIPVLDGPMDLSKFGGHTRLDEEAFDDFIEMYLSYYNRAPDAVGLSFWATAHADGMSLTEIANYFADQPETQQIYGDNISNMMFAYEVYQNVLGRMPDIEGIFFWKGALDRGDVTRGEFILELLKGVKAPTPAGAPLEFIAQQSADKAYLEQKVELGAEFAVHRGMSDVNAAMQVFKMFNGSSESFEAAMDEVEELHAAALDASDGDFLMPLVGVFDEAAAA